MLNVLSGKLNTIEGINKNTKWIQKKMGSNFDRKVDESWISDDIIREELRDVEGIVKFEGLLLTKDNGKRIPINWISQGSKQFIMATRYPDKYVVDCRHVGGNVYKYFYIWCLEKNVDMFMLMNSNGALDSDVEMEGIYLNSGTKFNGNRDLVDLIFDYRLSLLDPVIMNGKVSATFMGDCSSLPYPLKYKERYYIDLSRLNSKCS